MASTQANLAYAAITAMLDNDGYRYSSNYDGLRIELGFETDDLDVKITFIIDEDRELVRVFSFLPFKFPEDKRIEAAVAVCAANHGMVNGSFDYDISDGDLLFSAVNSYKDACFSMDIARYMLGITLSTVDKYNDRFYALAKGFISISDFINKENS